MDSRGPNAALIGVPGSRHALDTPALVLDIDVMQANIDSMAAYARDHGFQLRPVAKIHKSVDVARLQVAAGANGVTCATLAECEAMTDGGVPGCLLFTSVVSAQKLEPDRNCGRCCGAPPVILSHLTHAPELARCQER